MLPSTNTLAVQQKGAACSTLLQSLILLDRKENKRTFGNVQIMLTMIMDTNPTAMIRIHMVVQHLTKVEDTFPQCLWTCSCPIHALHGD